VQATESATGTPYEHLVQRERVHGSLYTDEQIFAEELARIWYTTWVFVGHLSERITDPRPFETPWSKGTQLRTGEVEAMQRMLTRLGIYKDKIDGKAGMLTRSALGAYQKANGLNVDCWPTAAVLAHMQAKSGNN